ncbi:ammonia-forming cytochrome c nitrite reductase subunit c552 [Intrasporangium calvum]|uniref:nitrite reductase (cytochrome; ammonia-forming) n=1 Tax=Intrasporangium calvum (strain ATCC 23552 / DSM 43043 / JCM 3097 / NBRC 12989 / NCIMB 10167 / NRRL B-3866 / 7 KIP) TaxID=710696 RepID=E6SB91_INTC7|nr:ammonia-forming cytochrome c nitrite reductase subunit c552 [Intrasporangium calvum]ADU48379.1 respiratory nitrite reductase (cytochrome; ammonia-forming) precursor [Intrasporangium calvum DSM 43043]AXG13414.1 ammonia-forming cytochrome c nitrite reductase subunit c552 [Intrasporangium calvum]
MSDNTPRTTGAPTAPRRRRRFLLLAFLVGGAVVTFAVAALLVNIIERRAEDKTTFVKVTELTNKTYDPAVWGQNFPAEYEGWQATEEMEPKDVEKRAATPEDPRTIVAQQKLVKDPRLVTMWQGYAFAIDYREPRGHAYMLLDQRHTRRTLERPQPGACLNCHASLPEITTALGNGDEAAGWAAMNKMPYTDATKLATHPVGCIDCHEPETMALRVTRPAFIEGIKELKASQGVENYDVNKQASFQEMRSFVCAQCHVEYYFKGEEKTLTFPWENGLTVDGALKYYDEVGFTDFTHKLTGARVLKAQHPDYETYSQGVHATAGVTCADCHMSYKREGAMKITDHQVRSPMTNEATINQACLTCHKTDEADMRARVDTIHDRYEAAKNVSFDALTALIKDIEKAAQTGVAADRIEKAQSYQRKAQFFVDYVVSENSRGFHAPQYTLRVLNDATDASRLGQLALVGVEPETTTKPALQPPATS